MQEQDRITEIVSALADGQLRGDEFARGVAIAAGNPLGREAWHTYHLVGEVLRTGEFAGGTMPSAFLGRLQARLLEEDAPVHAGVVRAMPEAVTARAAANDTSFRWKLVAGLASLAAVAAVGWSIVGIPAVNSVQPQLAVVSPPPGAVLTGTDKGVMVRDPRLDELLAAHRQLGSASALPTAGFLRNATYDGAGR